MTETVSEMKTAHEWMWATGIRLKEAGKWPETMSRETFLASAAAYGSMIRRWPEPLFDERPVPDQIFVDLLVIALKSEFGPEFGAGINASEESWEKMARGIAYKMGIENCVASSGGFRNIRMNLNVRN